MNIVYAAKLGFVTRNTNVGTQKIHGSALVTYGIVIASFSLQDKLGRVQFFEECLSLSSPMQKYGLQRRS